MTPNRRNFYRLLHVQPDAPFEVIKASYRALMTLHHPDVGGDHDAAVLLNEAYAVLSDTSRRAEYDRRRATEKT
jgi:curved DNA-binding protein CbpA